MVGRSFNYHIATAVALAVLASSPASAQLDQKLTEASQRLHSDIENCTPINMGDYATLLREAAENKQRADKAARRGVPIDRAKVYSDLANAQSLFNRANAALIRQCMRNATQPQPQSQPQSIIQSATLDGYSQRILDLHNGERAAIGLQPLHWNQSLADGAQGHANELARRGQLVHASREGRGTVRENLSQGMLGWNADQMMGNWLNERNLLTPGTFPNVCSGDWFECAHYTQIIWIDTTEIGCGMASGSGFQWLVCRYNPGGNKDGKPVGFLQTPQIASADGGGTAPGHQNDLGQSDSVLNMGIDPVCDGEFDVRELFAEIELPIIQNNIIDDLTIRAGYRYSNYHVVGNSFNTDTYKIEGELAPIPDIVELFFPQPLGFGCR